MAVNKTQYTEASVVDVIEAVEDKQKREDSYALIELMEKTTKEKAQMFGPSIIGFGKYQYKYDSGHAGEAPLIGFSPRKAAISLYVYTDGATQEALLPKLGKFKMGKSCIYVKKLSDINLDVLQSLMDSTINYLSATYRRV